MRSSSLHDLLRSGTVKVTSLQVQSKPAVDKRQLFWRANATLNVPKCYA